MYVKEKGHFGNLGVDGKKVMRRERSVLSNDAVSF
jgi:hypothetical protein